MILLISPKSAYFTRRFTEEAALQNAAVEVLSMGDLVEREFEIEIERYQALFVRLPFVNGDPKYFPQIIALAKKFKAAGKRVVDAVIAEGEVSEGKWGDYERLKEAGLSIPKTRLLVDSEQWAVNSSSGLGLLTNHYPLPTVLKWIYGFQGKGTFFIRNEEDLKNIPAHIPKEELMVQEFIPAEYEYKIITVGYKALPVILRFNVDKKTFKLNFSTACSMPIHRLPRWLINGHATGIIEIAESASRLLKRELAKVDILQSGSQFYILEVNRWPGLEWFERLTGSNIVKDFVSYIKGI